MLRKFVILAFVTILLCGCSKNDSKNAVSFASWGSITEVKILENLIQDFEKENPEIKINFMHIPQNYFQKMHLLIASNTAPDVIFINNLNIPIYKNHLVDLSDYIDKNSFYPQAINGLSDEGKLLAAPRDISNLVLYVNLDKTNLPSSNWSINDLMNYLKKTTNDTSFGISYEPDLYWITPYLTYFGGGIIDNKITSDNSIQAINFYKDLKNKYHYAPTKSQVGSYTLAQMFLDGKVAFYLSGRWMYPKITETAKFNWAVINFPYGKTPQYCDTSGWALYKKSKNKDSAIKFIKYISSEKSSKYFTQTGLVIPARINSYKFIENNNHNENIFIDVIKHSINTPVNKNYKKITDKLNKSLDL